MKALRAKKSIRYLGLGLACISGVFAANGCGTVVGNGQHISGDGSKRNNKKNSPVVAGDASAKESSENGTSSPVPESKGAPASVVMSDSDRAAKILSELIGVSLAFGCNGLFEQQVQGNRFALKFEAESAVDAKSRELAADSILLFKKFDSHWAVTVHFNLDDLMVAESRSDSAYPSIRYQDQSQKSWYYASAEAEPTEITQQCASVENTSEQSINGLSGTWQTNISQVEKSDVSETFQISWSYRNDGFGPSEIGALKIDTESESYRWLRLDLASLGEE